MYYLQEELERMNELNVLDWEPEDVRVWLRKEAKFSDSLLKTLCDTHGVDGRCLLALSENDFGIEPLSKLTLRDRKLFYVCVRNLQREHPACLLQLGVGELPPTSLGFSAHTGNCNRSHDYSDFGDSERISPPMSEVSPHSTLM